MTNVACINCGKDVHHDFCPHCGQKHPPKKISIVNLYYDFQARIYGFDGTFLRSVRDLTLRPGVVARSFVSGIRVKYIGPVGYYFLMLTLYVILMNWLGIDFADMASAFRSAQEQSEAERAFEASVMDLFYRNLKLFIFFQLLIVGVWCLVFFRKKKYNYLEHLVLIFYTSGHFFWAMLLAMVVFKFTGSTLTVPLLIGGFLFYAFGCIHFYEGKKTAIFFKGIMVSVLGYILYIVLFSILFLIIVSFDPEYAEMIRKMKQ